ncbi:hypothetical protein Clacol_001166 [Clathrus columnatus]|uniref:Uncharacterized protein n=1 Tax=Clathrus columnatus TaxID=1419009 RepID=A0AAV5A2J8_9AGAM|nr:hypothetical protein Clacol_001166 [Clathrus columnatus]
MASLTIDRAYTNLLEHLQRPKPTISLDTVFSSVPYYLSHLTLPHPTQLTAFFISSALWKQLTLEQPKSIITAFRSAVNFKHSEIQKSDRWFTIRTPQQQLVEWVQAILKGISRGDSQLKFCILGGILLGFDDLGEDTISVWEKNRVERQVVIACTEIMDGLNDSDEDPWKKEFLSKKSDSDSREVMFLYSCYTILPLLDEEKFSALNVQKLAYITEGGIESSFLSGRILDSSRSSMSKENNKVVIQLNSSLVKRIESVLNNQLYRDAPPLAKLFARCLSTLANQNPRSALETFKIVVEEMEKLNSKVEKDWNDSILSTAASEDDIDDSSKPISTDIWKILKTLLFSQLMVLQTILASLIYFKPSTFPPHISAAAIAHTILRSMHNQAFIISQFGGIAAISDGFKELKRVVYSTLDVIAADSNSNQQADLIDHLLSSLQRSQLPRDHASYQAQTAFTLTVMEQLITSLTDETIEQKIIPFAITYLDDTQHRDTFESAHSLILAIFTSQGKKQRLELGSNASDGVPSLSEKLTPFYTSCLIRNSEEGRLTTDQLRLTFSNLIKNVSSSGNDALAWFCVTSLLSHMDSYKKVALSPESSSSPMIMPLLLTLVSLMSCVPRLLLRNVLEEIRTRYQELLAEYPSQRDESNRAILEQIMSQVGDLDKEIVLTWWTKDMGSGENLIKN